MLQVNGQPQILAHDLAKLLFVTVEDPQGAGQNG
jgi:hypothetical protein